MVTSKTQLRGLPMSSANARYICQPEDEAVTTETQQSVVRFKSSPSFSKKIWESIQEKSAPDDNGGISKFIPDRYSEISYLMHTLKAQCHSDNWDGEGSSAIDADSVSAAWHFLLLKLPESLPLPTVWCDPSGRVTAEWFIGTASFAVTFKPDRTFLFAGYNAKENEVFFNTSSDAKVVAGMNRLLS